jgi:hypothetical protein
MFEHSSPSLIVCFVIAHLISLFLSSTLIFIILKTGSFITKWTLFQLCICVFILDLSSLPSLIIYGNDLNANSLLCIIQTKIMFFIYYPLELFPAVLSIYLWFAVARFDYNLERKFFWHFTGLIWVLTIILNIVDYIITRKEENWGVEVGVLFCIEDHHKRFRYSVILTLILTITSIIFTGIVEKVNC